MNVPNILVERVDWKNVLFLGPQMFVTTELCDQVCDFLVGEFFSSRGFEDELPKKLNAIVGWICFDVAWAH